MDKNKTAVSGTEFVEAFGHLTVEDALKEDWYKSQVTFRKIYLCRLIKQCKGNMSEAAEVSGFDRGSLYRTMKALKTDTYKSTRSVQVRRNKKGLIVMPETTADLL